MAKLVQTLIPTLFSTIALLLAAATTVQSQSANTNFMYDFSNPYRPALTLQGHAHFPAEADYLRLTGTNNWGGAMQNSIGRAMFDGQVLFHQEGRRADFQTTVRFIIRPQDSNPGDGFAFFMAPIGSVFPLRSFGPGLGVYNTPPTTTSVFAVEFDTVSSSQWDANGKHIGIDLGTIVSSKSVEVGDALVGQEVTAVISYVAATNLISVHVTAGSQTFEVSHVYDLSTLLDQEVQVGLSSSTGSAVAIHDVFYWDFTSRLRPIAAAIEQVV